MSALKGINLGGWLIAERWMTPALFDGVKGDGERAIGYELGQAEAERRLRTHRDTFITESDFKWLAKQRFDFVRLPVGYWLFEADEGFVSGEQYVRQAFRWAKKHRIGIVLDFHGLQGSQNGQDHSGQTGKIRAMRRHNRTKALNTLEYLVSIYGKEASLLGIELINEPHAWFGFWLWPLLRYYDQAIAIAKRYLPDSVKIIVSDAFLPKRMVRAIARRQYGDRVVLDVHLYQVFSRSEQTMTLQAHIDKVQGEWKGLLSGLSESTNVLVGEWSAALPAAAYDSVSGGEREQVYQYYVAQEALYQNITWGYCYWSYKAPGCGVWDWRESQAILTK